MPLAEEHTVSSSALSTPIDEGIGSMDSSDGNNEFGHSLKQTLFNLQSFNGQTKYRADGSESRDSNTLTLKGHRECDAGKMDPLRPHRKTEEDVMIVEDRSKTLSDEAKSIFNSPMANVPCTKPGSFAISDNMRNSFKDIISKIQTPSLGTLLSPNQTHWSKFSR